MTALRNGGPEPEFNARQKDFDSHLASQSAADDGSGDTRVNQDHDDGINRAFEMHELLDAFKVCKESPHQGRTQFLTRFSRGYP